MRVDIKTHNDPTTMLDKVVEASGIACNVLWEACHARLCPVCQENLEESPRLEIVVCPKCDYFRGQ